MTACIQQYEDRLKRVNDYMEQSNTSYLKAQEDLKQTRIKYEYESKQKDQFVQRLIEKSIELKNYVMTIDEKKNTSINKKTNMFSLAQTGEMMNDLELAIAKLMELKDESGSIVMELRDHLIEVYNRIGVSLLKRHLMYDEQLIKQEQEWQATCDRLIEDHQLIKNDSK